MGDISGGNFSLNNHTLSKQYCDSNHGDVSSGHVFLNSHTISQREDSSTFKNIVDDVENFDCDVSSGRGFLNSHNLFQIYNSSTFKNIDGDVDKGGVSSGYVSMNSHTDLQQKGLE